jgi:hypothetical protein
MGETLRHRPVDLDQPTDFRITREVPVPTLGLTATLWTKLPLCQLHRLRP